MLIAKSISILVICLRQTVAAQFDAFAFGPQSPIYRSGCSSLRHDSLYKALRDMWFQLCTRSNK